MSELISNAKSNLWEWRVAICWFILFSLNSLGTVLIAALTGVEWSTLSTQSQVMIGIAVWVNWSGTIMAFISKQAGRIKQTGDILPTGDTQFLTAAQAVAQANAQLNRPTPGLPISPANPPVDKP